MRTPAAGCTCPPRTRDLVAAELSGEGPPWRCTVHGTEHRPEELAPPAANEPGPRLRPTPSNPDEALLGLLRQRLG